MAPLGRDLPCPRCRHAHRFTPCDPECGCPAHPLTDEIEP